MTVKAIPFFFSHKDLKASKLGRSQFAFSHQITVKTAVSGNHCSDKLGDSFGDQNGINCSSTESLFKEFGVLTVIFKCGNYLCPGIVHFNWAGDGFQNLLLK